MLNKLHFNQTVQYSLFRIEIMEKQTVSKAVTVQLVLYSVKINIIFYNSK